jgi:hypothetical protein
MAARTASPVVAVRIDGIRGEGQIVSAVFARSKARLSVFQPMIVDSGMGTEALNDRLATMLYARFERGGM